MELRRRPRERRSCNKIGSQKKRSIGTPRIPPPRKRPYPPPPSARAFPSSVHRVTKAPPPPMPSIPGSPAVPRVRTAPTDPSTPRGGGGVQQQPPAMTVRTSGAASGSGKTPDFLSASAHVPRTRSGGAKSHFNNNSMSASERVPRTKRTIRTSLSASDRPARISSGGSSKSKGFGKRMPSITRGESPRRNGKE